MRIPVTLRNRRTVVVLAVLLICGAVKGWQAAHCGERWKFFLMTAPFADETPEQNQIIAEQLQNTEVGIDLALKDFDCSGGRTKGLSSLMLARSALTNKVNTSLYHIATDVKCDLTKRTEAWWILWIRTGDSSCVESLFLLVRDPYPGALIGRLRLGLCLDDDHIRERIVLPSEKVIDVTVDEIRQTAKRSPM